MRKYLSSTVHLAGFISASCCHELPSFQTQCSWKVKRSCKGWGMERNMSTCNLQRSMLSISEMNKANLEPNKNQLSRQKKRRNFHAHPRVKTYFAWQGLSPRSPWLAPMSPPPKDSHYHPINKHPPPTSRTSPSFWYNLMYPFAYCPTPPP